MDADLDQPRARAPRLELELLARELMPPSFCPLGLDGLPVSVFVTPPYKDHSKATLNYTERNFKITFSFIFKSNDVDSNHLKSKSYKDATYKFVTAKIIVKIR